MNNAIEIIIFGKGYGESILLHLNEKWIVVDSFLEPATNMPIAMKYLVDHGENKNIVGIICTHWDNDHILGISNMIDMVDFEIPVCVPIAKNDKRFCEYVAFYSDENISITSEFLRIMQLKEKHKCRFVYSISDRLLLGKEIGDSNITIKALSPNDKQFETFLESIIIPTKGQSKRIPLEENKISLVAYIKTCVDSILLGGDMENSILGGWDSICDSFYDSYKCHLFKVPHHGSSTAHNDKIWTTIVDYPISIITRFNNSHLPSDDMIRKIAAKSSSTYIVGPRPKKDRDTAKKIKKFDKSSAVRTISILDNEYGYIKLSKETEKSDWNIDEIFGAVEMAESNSSC